MRENNIKGHILNLSSSLALQPTTDPYKILKWAVKGFTLGLAKELLSYGVVVNAIAPGQTATPMLGKRFATSTYRITLGYFVQGKYVPIWMAIVNIVLSILLCKWIGLPGIFFATTISRLLGMTIVDPYLIYIKTFHKTPLIYWAKYIGYTLLVAAIGVICNLVITHIAIDGWAGVFVQIAVVISYLIAQCCLFFGKQKHLPG